MDEEPGSLLYFHGFYGEMGWFLTGETRPYDRQRAVFSRLHPRRDSFFRNGGSGAWELAGPVSRTDLNAGNISGGRMTLITGGVTWHPNPHIRWKFNYIYGEVGGKDPSGHLNIFETQVEVDF